MRLPLLLGAACVLAGCATPTPAGRETSGGTRQAALLIQSVKDSAVAFQRQRDTIAQAALAQRQALEASAMRSEAAVAGVTAAWEVGGQSERLRSFAALRASSAQLLALSARRRERELAQARDLHGARSALQFQSAKLNEAALTLMKLAEPQEVGQAQFYLAYAQALRAAIQQDSEAQAAHDTEQAQKGKDQP